MSVSTDILEEKVRISQPPLNAVVKGKDDDNENWKEVADVITYSVTGCAFYLTRSCKTGTLVSLMLPMPAEVRCYDHEKEFYRVWGLVQHCQKTVVEGVESFHIGIAFIGKNAPSTYHTDPSRNYRISGMNEDGLWKVSPLKGEFKPRQDIRYWQMIELYLAQVDSERQSLSGARAVTENISRHGAAVISKLNVDVGDRVKFISEEFDFSGMAVVCNRQLGGDNRQRLHLQFVDSQFPVEKLKRLDTPKA